MKVEKVQLWDDHELVTLETYILHNSKEFQEDKLRPAVVICPGGAYLGTSDREAEPIALRFVGLGYNAFVLRYTTYFNEWVYDFRNLPKPNEQSTFPQPLFDLAKAMLMIRDRADEWFVDINKIAVCGFSAGGHLAASLAVHWNSSFLKDVFKVESTLFKPNAVILGYPLLDYLLMKEKLKIMEDAFAKDLFELSNKAVFGTPHPSDNQLAELSPVNYVSSQTPPTFIWHTADDELVYAENSLLFATMLSKHHVPYELHIFESGIHGLSLCDETTASLPEHINHDCSIWFKLVTNWLKRQWEKI
jgi:acetyl esterase/lipase